MHTQIHTATGRPALLCSKPAAPQLMQDGQTHAVSHAVYHMPYIHFPATPFHCPQIHPHITRGITDPVSIRVPWKTTMLCTKTEERRRQPKMSKNKHAAIAPKPYMPESQHTSCKSTPTTPMIFVTKGIVSSQCWGVHMRHVGFGHGRKQDNNGSQVCGTKEGKITHSSKTRQIR